MNEEYVINKIRESLPGEHTVPMAASWTEIQSKIHEDLMQTVRNLCKEGKIGFHKTLNGLSFYIK